ncbi:MAG TPA: hypothetical protein VGL95_16900 [Acetobacteraceae bacterium]
MSPWDDASPNGFGCAPGLSHALPRSPVRTWLRSGFIGFDDINAGFDRLAKGAVLRQVFQPNAAKDDRNGAGAWPIVIASPRLNAREQAELLPGA